MMRIPALSLTLAVSSVILFFAFGPASELLVFQREALLAGEVGRLISAHFVHSDGAHLVWNLLAFIILGGLLELREGGKQLLLYLLLGIVSVDVYVVWQSGLEAYCGLSGVLNTLLVGVLISLYREPTLHPLVMWIGIAVVVKIAVEVLSNQALLTHTVWPSVPLAHLYGFSGGLMGLFFRSRLFKPTSSVALC